MSDLGLRIVEVEPAPCQHMHASNYDPAAVVPNQPIQVLGDGRLWCFDCEEFFTPQVLPRRYTLEQIEVMAWEFVDNSDASAEQRRNTLFKYRMFLSSFLIWLAKREREGLNVDKKS